MKVQPKHLAIAGLVLVGIATGWLLFAGLPRWYGGAQTAASVAAPPPPAPVASGRKINAHLFYVSEDGMRLTSVDRDIPYGDNAPEQAREIVQAQLAAVNAPLVSAIPAGTTLRAIFLTDKGEAYVDLSKEVVTAHPGGTINELLTVYTIINALTTNLPAIHSVQVLVDGKEAETLVGHMDLRRPLAKNLDWVQQVQ